MATGLRPTERLFIEKTLLRMYPRLQRQDLFPWSLFSGPLIPEFLVRHTSPRLRRIVVIGCKDGVLCNILSLLFPDIEIVGIDASSSNIAKARATVGHRQNLKFVYGNASTMLEIPCDRIIYDCSLSQLGNGIAFKKLLAKTLRWIVDDGDFIVRETPLKLLRHPKLLQEFWPKLKEGKCLEACIQQCLGDINYPHMQTYQYRRIPKLSSEVYFRGLKNPEHYADSQIPVQESVTEWQDFGDQSTHSVLGFLFANQQHDFSRELK